MSGTGNQITTLETNIEEFINIEKSFGNGIFNNYEQMEILSFKNDS